MWEECYYQLRVQVQDSFEVEFELTAKRRRQLYYWAETSNKQRRPQQSHKSGLKDGIAHEIAKSSTQSVTQSPPQQVNNANSKIAFEKGVCALVRAPTLSFSSIAVAHRKRATTSCLTSAH